MALLVSRTAVFGGEVPLRPAWVDIDLDVIHNNAAVLRETFAPAELCAVVKADGYGHGAVPVAKAALAGGATWLAVALVEEGRELRMAGISEPILVLSQPPASAMAAVAQHDLTLTVYSPEAIVAANNAAREHGKTINVHLKVNTGMNRVGAPVQAAVQLAQAIAESDSLVLQGVFTHFAVADEPQNGFTAEQAERFAAVVESLAAVGLNPPLVHSSNSAAGLLAKHLGQSLVRCGIALYGIPPSAEVALPEGVRPAMSVRAQVSYVYEADAGDTVSYGRRYTLKERTTLAVLPVGYADGLPRQLSNRGSVLIRGEHLPIAGTVTMDQVAIDCGPGSPVQVGDEAVLLGAQGGNQITADDWGEEAGTIGYDIVCRIGPRLPRRYLSST